MKFIKKKHVLEHESKIHKIIFTCDHCSRSFSSKKLLLRHILYVHMATHVVCHICRKSVKNLAVHMRQHEVLRPKCTKCGCKVLKRNLKGHEQSCSPYCMICNRKFTSNRYLTQHNNVHHVNKLK